ncbi:MAG: PD-(D/E)XK nuclease domain-containing protein, partial [Desulfovibrionaceae bacterium]|nr:PD-(D/E)XK nuclease domain-containing protein [Desulfovibrionaceae bacterium]
LRPVSNHESGHGRPDIIVQKGDENITAVIELKRAPSENALAEMARKALQQIEEKKYAVTLEKEHKVIRWGIAFHGKKCLAIARTGSLSSRD